MVPEKKYENLILKLNQLEEENIELKRKLGGENTLINTRPPQDYEAYFNNSLDSIFITESIYGVPSSFITVNDAFAKLLQYTKEEIKELDPLEILAEGEKKRLLLISDSILEQQELYFLTAFKNKKKQRITVELSLKTLDKSINPKIIGVARNVADKEFALNKKDQTEIILKKIADGTSEIVLHISAKPSFSFNYISPAAKNILGYTPTELYKNPLVFLRNLHPEDYKTLMGMLDKAIDTALPQTLRFLRKDEKLVWLEIYLTYAEEASTHKTGFYAIIHDITYRQQMERLINKKLKTEHLISKIAQGFIDFSTLKEIIHQTIEDTGKTMKIDGIQLSIGHGTCNNSYIWVNPKIKSPNKKIQINLKQTEWIHSKLQTGDIVYLVSIKDIPSEFKTDRKLINEQNIKSILTCPLQIYGKTMGYFAFYQMDKIKEWDRVEIHLISTVANIINAAIQKEILQDNKDSIFELANKHRVFNMQFPAKRASFILTFTPAGKITGCLGKPPLFLQNTIKTCETNTLQTLFEKQIVIELKKQYHKLSATVRSVSFSIPINKDDEIQDFSMIFHKENKYMLCLYSD